MLVINISDIVFSTTLTYHGWYLSDFVQHAFQDIFEINILFIASIMAYFGHFPVNILQTATGNPLIAKKQFKATYIFPQLPKQLLLFLSGLQPPLWSDGSPELEFREAGRLWRRGGGGLPVGRSRPRTTPPTYH